jgi:hypothetical protein
MELMSKSKQRREFYDVQQAMEHWGEKGPCEHPEDTWVVTLFSTWCSICGAMKFRDNKWRLPERKAK